MSAEEPRITSGCEGTKHRKISAEFIGFPPARSVSEEKQDERDETREGITWHRVERSSSFNSRALRFPDAADLSKVNANVENGVLRVTISKRPEAQVKRKTIQVA